MFCVINSPSTLYVTCFIIIDPSVGVLGCSHQARMCLSINVMIFSTSSSQLQKLLSNPAISQCSIIFTKHQIHMSPLPTSDQHEYAHCDAGCVEPRKLGNALREFADSDTQKATCISSVLELWKGYHWSSDCDQRQPNGVKQNPGSFDTWMMELII